MIRVHFFHKDTGVLHPSHFISSDPALVALNTPADHEPIDTTKIDGIDHMSQRVDLEKLHADDDAAATEWAARKDERKLSAMIARQAHPRAKSTPAAPPAPDVDPPPPRAKATADHLVDYQPPQPSDVHEWNATSKRWQLTAAAQSRANDRVLASQMIQRLEVASLRPQREMSLGMDGAKARLQSIDDEIAQWRAKL